MRSEQVHHALAQGYNRFEICRLVSKGVRATHKPGARFEDSIGDVLEHLTPAAPWHASEQQPTPVKAMAPAA
jgi:hypothetical protein